MHENPLNRPVDRTLDTIYKVQKGDSLASISKKFYGSSDYWEFLYYYNCRPDVVNFSGCRPLAPNLLYEGQVCVIPSNNQTLKNIADTKKKELHIGGFTAHTVKNWLKEGVEFPLPDAPGLSYTSANMQVVMKYTAGALNIKLTNEEDFSAIAHGYASTENIIDTMKETSKEVFKNVMKAPKIQTYIDWKSLLHLKNWQDGTVFMPKKAKVSYDFGAFETEFSAKKGEYSKVREYFKLENQRLQLASAKTGFKSENYFCSLEFSFDTPPLMIGLGTFMLKATASGNMGGQLRGFELAWKNYGADMVVIIKIPPEDDKLFDSPLGAVVPNGFFLQNSVDQYIAANYRTTPLNSPYLFNESGGAKFGAMVAEEMGTGRMSQQEAAILGVGIVTSAVVGVGVICILAGDVVALAGAMIATGCRYLTHALASMFTISIPAMAAPSKPQDELKRRVSPDTITGKKAEVTDARVREMQLTIPARRFIHMKKTIPLELVLVSQRKHVALTSQSGKKTPIEFKISN
ncbi:MAG: LysM domain-containing protein [Bdellovibrionota bacterium]